MIKSFADHFRTPEGLLRFSIDGNPGSGSGFFRFGGDVVCFGRTSAVPVAGNYFGELSDSLPAVTIRDSAVQLPFDPDQVVSNLRNEVYTGQVKNEFTRLGSHPAIRAMYYWGRPLFPVPMRSVLQRIYLRGELSNPFPVWPVDRTVETLFEKMMLLALQANHGQKIPFVWFWPEGAQAAFILTHDVESTSGKEFTPALMDLDDRYGFKASFQLIPEKRYELSAEFVQSIKSRGFEVNVHDLNHDGNLFREHHEFLRRADRINGYVREFGSEGFRSGALYRNLLWYDAFRFSFDMSVPNVGHLDPQGGGCCTTFPYFVGDILEIPVTCTQDYSLFHILKQYSIALWKQQFGIIVKANGLVSLIIHPDYVIEPRAQSTVRELLGFIREQVAAREMWTPLPGEVNRWWRLRREMRIVPRGNGWAIEGQGSERARVAYACLEDGQLRYSFDGDASPQNVIRAPRPVEIAAYQVGGRELSSSTGLVEPPAQEVIASSSRVSVPVEDASRPRRPLRIAMVSYSFYETDNRVLRYASTLAKRGDYVDVFALRREGKPAEEEMEGVHVHRLQGRTLNEKNRLSYAWRICQFLARATAQVAKYDLKNRYDLLHIHSVPDFMVFSALLPKLRGTPVILDIHDILPEFYASKFAAGKQSSLFRLLVGVERASSRFATHVIIANDIWRERLVSRTLSPDKCTVVLNSPDRSIFRRTGNGHQQNGKFLMLYPGSLNWHQGIDIAIRAFAKISKKAPHAQFHIYGDGPSKTELLDLVKELQVESQVKMPSARPLQEIAQIMETASLGVVPKRKDNFGNEAFSTKILEFMAMGVPVVVADTMIDKFYFDDSVVKFFRGGDVDDLARRMLEMIENPLERERQIENANRFVETIDWTAKRHEYLELVDRLSLRSGS